MNQSKKKFKQEIKALKLKRKELRRSLKELEKTKRGMLERLYKCRGRIYYRDNPLSPRLESASVDGPLTGMATQIKETIEKIKDKARRSVATFERAVVAYEEKIQYLKNEIELLNNRIDLAMETG